MLGTVLGVLAMPLPATAKDKAKPTSPKGNMGNWFPQDIYPVEAKRKGEQGRVVVQLSVDKSGGATACRVIESSGSKPLDARTCELALANARFVPALDTNGNPTDATFTLPGVRWALATDPTTIDVADGPVSTSRDVEIMVNSQGLGVSCRALSGFNAKAGCENFQAGTPVTLPVTSRGRPVAGKVTITTTMRVEAK